MCVSDWRIRPADMGEVSRTTRNQSESASSTLIISTYYFYPAPLTPVLVRHSFFIHLCFSLLLSLRASCFHLSCVFSFSAFFIFIFISNSFLSAPTSSSGWLTFLHHFLSSPAIHPPILHFPSRSPSLLQQFIRLVSTVTRHPAGELPLL